MALWTVKRQGSSAAKTVVFRTYAGLLLAYALTFFLYSITSNGGLETRKDGGGVVGERLRAPRESTELEEAANETVSTEHSAEMQSNCSRPSVENFPQGVFSMDTLRHGALAVDVVAVVYMFGALAIVCDSYFMPALEIICSVLHLSEDVAGATFMAIGGSAPELFTSIVGVFISKGDIGIGTILGSAVFNVLFVIGLCGLLAGKTIYLTCWPLTRDSCCYIMSILALVFVVSDGVVTWAESAAMLVLYCMYIVLMYFNPPTERYVDRNMAKCRCRRLVIGESGRAGGEGRGAANLTELANLMEEGEESDEEDEEEVLHIANGNGNIRRVDKGFALRIPDTVMGLTLLAAGSSVPDLILSVIAAREGYGDMAISHSIGSNLFDILLGLGLPWFLSSVAVQSGRSVAIHSGGVVYITALLLGNVVAMVLLIRLSGFLLNKKLGLLLILLYAAFLVLSVFLEMSAVLGVNELPVCGM
ncbi:sodium/potassium/calcium exchanger 3-like isoform X2 [Acanthaster planci]|uniref:Sodium/potassium/calcium exchanger 3-like isoform X2 n=1 Tax=Acanthaster planci TaxID=133434 RepID=A0A8B7ZZ80_ACAPL|nr:sodium/potassium/calcium exchanger 3-like isoform X2 [Acanthaster planci]